MLSVGAAQAKTLVYCSEGSPEGFDPALYTAGTTFNASSRPVYSQLVEFERGTTNTVPGVAESWDVSEDGLEYTFHLRPGVKFQTTDFFTPTRDLNADDVIFSFERQRDPNHPWHEYTAGTSWEYFNGMSMPDLLKEIVKVDDITVKFVLTRPEAPMIANLAMDFASIVSKEYADQLEAAGNMEQLNQQPVGTGPFQWVAYQKDAVIRYRAHPDYWDGKQPIDDLVFAITTDASVRQQKLQAGECHVAPYPNPADIEALKADPNLEVMEQEGLNVGYLAYNTQQAPFDNTKVRKALNMAINKQAILEAVYQGAGAVAKNPIPPTMWSYNEEIEDDPYDPGSGPQDARGRGRHRPQAEHLGHAGAAALQPERPPHGRADAGRLRRGRGRTSRSSPTNGASIWSAPRPSTATGRCFSAGPATTATRTTSSPFCSAVTPSAAPTGRSGATRSSTTWCRGQDALRPGRAGRALPPGPGGVQARGAVGDHRALHRVHADVEEGQELQDGPAGIAPLRWRRHRGVASRRRPSCSGDTGMRASALSGLRP
jgi:hypothetical protein